MKFNGTEVVLGSDAIMVSNGIGEECFLVRMSITDKIEISKDVGKTWKYLREMV